MAPLCRPWPKYSKEEMWERVACWLTGVKQPILASDLSTVQKVKYPKWELTMRLLFLQNYHINFACKQQWWLMNLPTIDGMVKSGLDLFDHPDFVFAVPKSKTRQFCNSSLLVSPLINVSFILTCLSSFQDPGTKEANWLSDMRHSFFIWFVCLITWNKAIMLFLFKLIRCSL